MIQTSNQGDGALEKRRLRMWIRMLRTTRTVETQLRNLLRDKFDTTLPRFDVLAALYRAEGGLKMNALSKQLLVSNGNVTGIVDRLESDGLVTRVVPQNDRRSNTISLSQKGRDIFIVMASEHEAMVNQIFSEMEEADLDLLANVFERLKQKDDNHDQDG